ncbi:PRC-barrel domain-containing protein [Modicisalibacter ilicicola DSM 19980]|uniref:PRC-barrel domain-containing protein n=1 Tax=Modicisalibacter ilicicola DSM 19980 TaxID=1121942 RepID=A0A1M5ACK7_9GAMM|nr:PRC-barrel domain-containing protein [Halomonas ilicicola]SHF27622.1 PRC-barrel domain-containing protein [Halomonas ilicicola DSM 19980]
MQRNRIFALLLSALAATSLAQAQDGGSSGDGQDQGRKITPVSDWSYDRIYEAGGFRADRLMEAVVKGAEDGEIGSVENALISADNRILALVARVGGSWNMGDKYVAIPWEEVTLAEDGLKTPLREDNVEDYGLFDEAYVTRSDLQDLAEIEDDVATGPRVWKLSELLSDYAVKEDGSGFGHVSNVLFSQRGEMQAVIVEPSADEQTKGPYAYPFHGYDDEWAPRQGAFELPASPGNGEGMQAFDYSRYASPFD